ncbi:MAG: multifunctional CCA addition/repair protein [Proteobacteria bacterium]|nr:multifunctional CCA addition/repair protein [Pseudomonadota bacterium]
MKCYLVGGAVRDELLGLTVHERDWVVVGASQDEMLNKHFVPVGKFFPVFLHPETKEEYALARLERKVGGGYHGFTFDSSTTVTLEEDLKRRDLTINAMAKTQEGVIIDPFDGQTDLKNKILRHVSQAFIEDPVRVLRVARFAARFAPLGFTVAPETLALMEQMVNNGELDFLVPERVWQECVKALSSSKPVAFIQTLRQCKALQTLFPEIDALYGVPQNEVHHPEIDTGVHIELVLAQATQLSSSPEVRFAALVHDVGKALTEKALLPNHPLHEEKGESIVLSLCERLRVPATFLGLARLMTRYHGEIHSCLNKTPQEVLQLLEKLDAYRRTDRFEQLLLACEADFKGRPGYETKSYLSGIFLKKAFTASLIDVSDIVKAHQEKGESIKNAIHAARLVAIAKFKETYIPGDP